MTTARRDIVWDEEAGTYHCTVRCVRRAFLCGFDAYSGENYDHRKQWIRDRLQVLTRAFGVDALAYAVMSNHSHVVVRTCPDRVKAWTDEEVVKRWFMIYPPKHGIDKDGHMVYKATDIHIREVLDDPERVDVLRNRMGSLSWFMKSLNEYIARRANKEDECKGRFWEGRFKCQRLEGEAGILACMSYVDLNPVRAGIADSLEDSEFTSIYDRIMAEKARKRQARLEKEHLAEKQLKQQKELIQTILDRESILLDLDGEESPFSVLDTRRYMELVDWTGRQLRKDKPGVISPEIRPLLDSLDLDAREWVNTVRMYRKRFGLVAGTAERIREVAAKIGKCWLKGCRSSEAVFVKAGHGPPVPA